MITTTVPARCTATYATDCDCSECAYERSEYLRGVTRGDTKAPRSQKALLKALRDACWLARERRA